jgi:response regulator of citrate/malate metabolism
VLTVGYPGGKTRQISLRPGQVEQVQGALENYRNYKQTLEAISELNQFLLVLDREDSKRQERQQ